MSIWFPILVSIGVSTSGGLVGLSAHAFQAQGYDIGNPSTIFQNVLTAISTPWWVVIVIIGILAAGLSTVAGNMNGASLIVTYDFVRILKKDISDEKLKNYGRIFILSLMFIVYIASIYSSDAVTALVQLSTAFYSMALYPIVTIFIWRRGTYVGTLAGMVGSLGSVIVTNFIYKNPLGVMAGF